MATRRRTAHPAAPQRRGAAPGHRAALLVQPDRVPQRVDDGPGGREYLVDVYGDDGLPFNTRFGNGDPIGEEVVELINQVYEANTARAVAGRRPDAGRQHPHRAQPGGLRGPREVLVGMADPVTPGRCLAAVEVTADDHHAGCTARPAGRPGTVPPFAVISGCAGPAGAAGSGEADRGAGRGHLPAARCRGFGEPAVVLPAFPDRPSSRIIALPASIGGPARVDGLKWISSFPENVAAGIPRASAVLILNDHDTGYPFACLESSIISATRTAASAALAADWLSRGRPRPSRIGFVGTG